MYTAKNTKYRQICIDNGYQFQPIVLETNGNIHPEVLKFLRNVAKQATVISKIDEHTLYNYYLKVLSVQLQIGLAQSINEKLLLAIRDDRRDYGLDNEAIQLDEQAIYQI